MGEPPVANGTPSDEHLLTDEWTLYLNERPPKGITQEEYERIIHKWGVFSTVEGFWRHMNALDIQKLPSFCTLRMFKSGIKPSWEDPANSRGGKFILDSPKNTTPRLWRRLVLAIIGSTLSFSEQICGVVLSVRPQKDTLQIWNRDADEVVCMEDSLRELRGVVGFEEDTAIHYQPHKGLMDFFNVKERTHQLQQAEAQNESGSPPPSEPLPTDPDNRLSNSNGAKFTNGHAKENGQPESEARPNKNSMAQRKVSSSRSSEEEKVVVVVEEEENKDEANKHKETQQDTSGKEQARETGQANGEGKEPNGQANVQAVTKVSRTQSVDWGELAEEGEDEASDTSWLTEDDNGNGISFEEDALLAALSEQESQTAGQEEEEANRDCSLNSLRSSQFEPGSRPSWSYNRSSGEHSIARFYENDPPERMVRKSLSNADIRPKKPRGANARIDSRDSSDIFSQNRHKRSISTSIESMHDPQGQTRFSQDKQGRARRTATSSPTGFQVQLTGSGGKPSGLAMVMVPFEPAQSVSIPRSAGLKRSNQWKGPSSLPSSNSHIHKPFFSASASSSSAGGSIPRTLQESYHSSRHSSWPWPPEVSDDGGHSAMQSSWSPQTSHFSRSASFSSTDKPFPSPGPRPKERTVLSPKVATSSASASSSPTTSSDIVRTRSGSPTPPPKGFKREYFFKPRDPSTQKATPNSSKRTWSPRGQRPESKQTEEQAAAQPQKEKANPGEEEEEESKGRTTTGAAAPKETTQEAKREDPNQEKKHLSDAGKATMPPGKRGKPNAENEVKVVQAVTSPSERACLVGAVQPPEPAMKPNKSKEPEKEVSPSRGRQTNAEDDTSEEEDSDQERGRRKPEVARISMAHRTSRTPPRRKTPRKGKRLAAAASSAKRSRRSRGPIIDFLKAHEQEFYFIFAALVVLLLSGTAFLLFGIPSNLLNTSF